jgi:hypothetical protein
VRQGSGGSDAGNTVRGRRHRLGLVCVSLAVGLSLALAYGSASQATAPVALVQQGSKLTATEEAGKGEFGHDVALSADGETALIGAPRDGGETGAAVVLTRSGSTWIEQAKLTSGESVEEGHFGHNVALSGDGDTAAISAPTFDQGSGAVWIFTRSGSTWTEQAKLTGVGELDVGHFGAGLALSSDGDTVAIGAPNDDHNVGAVWVFTRSGSTWTQQGEKLTGGEASGASELGRAVALSADGSTALVGGPCDDGLLGAAWAFARSGTTWAQQGTKLTGGEASGESHFGDSVALSADGATALVGGRQDGGKAGAAWAFARSGTTWAQQGAKLVAASGEEGTGELGWSVALSADGETALIGGLRDDGYAGAAWLFARSGSTWAQQGEKLTGGEEERGKGWFGSSVALSAEATTALVGGVADNGRAGAVWVFGLPSTSPNGGSPPSGGASAGTGNPQVSTGISPVTSVQAKQGVDAFKAAGGGVVLLGRSLPVRGTHVKVRLRCTAPVACRGRLVLTVRSGARAARHAKPVAIGTIRFTIAHQRVATVTFRVNAAGRSDLSVAHGKLRATLTIHVSAPDPPQVRAYAVKLVRRQARRVKRK